MKVKVTVIIPTMNEAESIGLVLDSIPKMEDMEVLLVDTNSKDGTVEIAEKKGARVINEARRGYGRAYKTGFLEAKGDIIVTLDGDCTYPAEDVPGLVKRLKKEGLDFITCDRLTKMEKGAMSTKHKFGNWVLNVTTRVLFGVRIRDTQSGMWVFRRSLIDRIALTDDGMPLSEELKIEAFKAEGVKAAEVPIVYRVRKGEVKLSSWKDGWKNLKFLFRKRFGTGGPARGWKGEAKGIVD